MIIRGNRRTRAALGSAGPAPARETIAREIARAKYLARYFKLECGHLGTLEDDNIFRQWSPGKYLHWCDYDGWVRLAPDPKVKSPVSDTPLF
jgi:hypothetical protein